MAGNRYDSGQGADPRGGWSAPPQQQAAPGGYGPTDGPEYFTGPQQGPGGPSAPQGPTDPYGPGPRSPYASQQDPYGGQRDPYAGQQPYAGQPQEPYAGPQRDPYAADQPGHTRAFPVGADPYAGEPSAYGQQGWSDDQGQQGQGYGEDNVAVYRAGGQSAPQATGPRPGWRELLTGLFRTPTAIFDRTRDHQVWLPAVTVSLLYGALAVLGLGMTRDDVVNSTFTVALTALLAAAIGFTLAGAMLGAVTYALARQFGGDGPWQSTVGLAVLIGWVTDAPRLLLALVLPADNLLVQVVGWATWLLCAFLLTSMVRRVHDLPWGKAAGAAALQLLALLVLIKLPTLG
ncbi:YIP1 family protein [Kitasatospora purpeofusca]|uniref:YIP1 family protein n=1 Tax=Kitasatospora purpeofusca TaxID=67352 RepID=A0ABZ1U1A6_9ACTN|nr:YIP1 family protein [Kitasatospora purpeofusca]